MKNSLITRPDSFFDSFFNDSIARGYSFGNNIDIYHKDNEYVVEVNVPGFSKEDINVSFDNDILSISAKRDEDGSEEEKNYIYRSRRHREYSRQIRFDNVDSSRIDAAYENGVLKITLPDREKKEPITQRIEVK